MNEDTIGATDGPAWIPCPHCDEYWCTLHRCHAFECDCPPIEEWEEDPYSAPPGDYQGVPCGRGDEVTTDERSPKMTTMTASDKIHVFEAAGLGTAPFRLVCCIEIPSKSLLETNPGAYNDAFREANQAARGLGVRLCMCDFCGHDLHFNYVIRSADGKMFVVGSECVMKTKDAGLVSRVEHEEKRRSAAKREAARAAEWERTRPEREARIAAARAARERHEAEARALADRLADENGWLVGVLESQSWSDFCRSVAEDLRTRKRIADLSPRCLEIVADIFVKAVDGRPRKGSRKYNEAIARFYDRAGVDSKSGE